MRQGRVRSADEECLSERVWIVLSFPSPSNEIPRLLCLILTTYDLLDDFPLPRLLS
jgi:hypothetical protein